MSVLAARFTKLNPKAKAQFLAYVAHEATIYARTSYIPTNDHPNRNFENPDAIILRDANNFVHRVVGYIPHALNGTEGADQDGFVMEMIEDYFQWLGATALLTKWLDTSK